MSTSWYVSFLQQPTTDSSPYFVSVVYETADQIGKRRRWMLEEEKRVTIDIKGELSFQILKCDVELTFIEETEYIEYRIEF